jgi:predicted Zn-dependent protease
VLGARVAAEIRQKAGSIESAAVEDYFVRLGARLTAMLPETGFAWSFTVTAADVGGGIHEPFPAPGGNILVPASLFEAARDEAEFAGMLAHAVWHAATRNGALRGPYGGFMFHGGWTSVRIMADAGYDPEALARYIARVQEPGTRLESPLPERARRLAAIRRDIVRRLRQTTKNDGLPH